MSNELTDWIDGFYTLNPDAARHDSAKAKKPAAIPLQLELSAMDNCDMGFYMSLTPEQKKEISLWILMRFMSSSQSSAVQHLTLVNDMVNVNFNIISKHPELQWKLLAVCGTNKKQFHTWIPPGKKAKKNKLEEALISLNPLMKDDELELLQRVNTQADFELYFRENAFDDKTIKEIFKSDTKGK